MSWTDKCALETIWKLAKHFKVKEFVETGTFMGINAEVHATHFELLETSEINEEYWRKSFRRLNRFDNVGCYNISSKRHIKEFIEDYKKSKRKDYVIFYLDAHFYNPKGPRWVVREELKTLKGFDKAIVIIHDFNNGLGHCIYDGERLGWNVVGKDLMKINKNFKFYTNNLDYVDIVKPREMKDEAAEDNIKYLWKTPRLTYRGILYALPKKVRGFKLVSYSHR